MSEELSLEEKRRLLSEAQMSRNLGSHYQQLLDVLAALLKRRAEENNMRREPMQIRDRMIAVVRTRDGKVKLDENGQPMIRDTGWSINGITNAWLANIAGLQLTDVGGESLDYIGIGTGTDAFDPTQTDLINPVLRKAAAGSRETTTVTNDTSVLTATFSSADGLTGTHAITESGAFSALTGGIMACRQVFSALNVNWDAGDSLQVTWKIQVKQAT
ncbi:MAG: hypothetical protein DRJ18_01395 [Candidatus Methanomethylicota archaeon]|nr:MAG: hypothetical protein DRJ18_01395 [Candidatus Verstraetearchaeota archaeon]